MNTREQNMRAHLEAAKAVLRAKQRQSRDADALSRKFWQRADPESPGDLQAVADAWNAAVIALGW